MQTIYFLKAQHDGNQYRPVLNQYHQVPTSTALHWPSIQWFDGLDHVNQIFSESISHWQPAAPCFDQLSPSTDQYHPILTQYHQVTTSAALYRPSTIKYQSVPPNTDPVPPSINKYCSLLTQYDPVQTSIWKNINWQIFAHQLDVISMHIWGRVWSGLPVILFNIS